MAKKNTQARRYQLTINDKEEVFNFDAIRGVIQEMDDVRYFAMSEERGAEEGTRHFHIYLEFTKRKFFRYIKEHWSQYTPHIEGAIKGTSEQNRDYVLAQGKHERKEENLIDHYEDGEMATETQGKRTDIDAVVEMLDDGYTPEDIRQSYPKSYLMHQRKIKNYFEDIQKAKYMEEIREVEVYYVWGGSGTGKTSGIYKKEGLSNVYRVNNYDNPFDGYSTQDVIVLEEFHSQLQFGLLLQITEGYPLYLKARYNDKVACYTKVYIVSNMEWSEQYQNIQYEKPNVFKAMDRRIKAHIQVNDFGDFENYFENEGLSSYEMACKLFGEDIVTLKDTKEVTE